MIFSLNHANINITDINKSLSFYKEALNLSEVRRKEASDGSFTLIFIGDGKSGFTIELTYLKNKVGKYELGDNESHIALSVDDFESAYKKHKQMNCVCYENTAMGIYFIEDPDGYWWEILPQKR